MPQVEVVIEYHDEDNSYHTTFDVPKYKLRAEELRRLLTTRLPEQGFDVQVSLNPPLGKGFIECSPHWFVKRENGTEKKIRYPGLGAFEVTLHCRGQFSDRLPPSIQVWSKIRTHLWPDAKRLTTDLEHLLSVASQDGDVKDLVARFRDHSSGDVSLRYKPALQSKTPSRFMQWRGNTRRRNEPMIFGLTPRLKAPIDAWSTIDVDKLAAARGQDDELVRRFREEVRDMEGRPVDTKVPKAMQSPAGDGSQRRRFSLPQSMGSGQLQSWRPPSAASNRSDRGARGSARAPASGASSAPRASSAGPARGVAQHSPARFTASAGSESRGRDSFPPASPSVGSVHSAAEAMQHEESTPKMVNRNGSGSFHEVLEPRLVPPKPPLPEPASTPPHTKPESTARTAPEPSATTPPPAADQPAATTPPPTQPAATPPASQPAATPPPTTQPAATLATQPEAPQERVEQPKVPQLAPQPQAEAPPQPPPQSARSIDDLRQRMLQKYTSSRSVASIFEETMKRDLDTPLNADEFKEALMYKSQLRLWEQPFACKRLFEEVAAGREEVSLRDLQHMLEKGWPTPPPLPPPEKKEEAFVQEERKPEPPPRQEAPKPDEAVHSDYDSEFEEDPEDTQPKAPVAAAKPTPAPLPPVKPSAPADIADEHDGYPEDFDEDDQRPAQEEPPKPTTPKPAPAKPAPALNTSYKDDFEDDIPEDQGEQTKKVTPPSIERPSSAAPRPVPKSDGTAASTATTAAKNDGSDYDEDFDEDDDPPLQAKKVTIQGQVYDYAEDNWLDSEQSSEPGEGEDIEENQEIY